jgi:ABC-type amino acid transport substrate-binding protein
MDARCVRKAYITGTEKRRIMKKTGSNRIISAAIAAALVLTGTGCGKAADGSQSSVSEAVSSTAAAAQTSSSAASTSAASSAVSSSGSVEKVVIGTEGAYAPYNLVNENGDPVWL